MTRVVMLPLLFPVKGTMLIQSCLINTVIWLGTQEKYIHREILYIGPYHTCLPMYTQLTRQWVIFICCATTLGKKQRRVERLVML